MQQGNCIVSSEILSHQRQAFELLVMDKNLNLIYLVLYSWATGQTCKVGSLDLVLKKWQSKKGAAKFLLSLWHIIHPSIPLGITGTQAAFTFGDFALALAKTEL